MIVNPFQSYFGGDVNKNNELSAFFRMWLDPEIKDQVTAATTRAAVMFMRHLRRPPNVKEREGWGVDMFAAYIWRGRRGDRQLGEGDPLAHADLGSPACSGCARASAVSGWAGKT